MFQRSFNAVKELTVRGYGRTSAVGLGLLVPLFANAALSTEATAMFTDAAATFLLVIALAYTLLVAVTGGWITFDMVKRGAKKAAK